MPRCPHCTAAISIRFLVGAGLSGRLECPACTSRLGIVRGPRNLGVLTPFAVLAILPWFQEEANWATDFTALGLATGLSLSLTLWLTRLRVVDA